MAHKLSTSKQPIHHCDICHKEIPESIEIVPKEKEYIRHFCSLDCYLAWHEEHTDQEQPIKKTK